MILNANLNILLNDVYWATIMLEIIIHVIGVGVLGCCVTASSSTLLSGRGPRASPSLMTATEVVSLDVIPLLSHTLHDLISFYNIYISCYLFISLTLKSGAIMFINCLIIPAPVGVNNAFQCVGVEHTLFFFFFKWHHVILSDLHILVK